MCCCCGWGGGHGQGLKVMVRLILRVFEICRYPRACAGAYATAFQPDISTTLSEETWMPLMPAEVQGNLPVSPPLLRCAAKTAVLRSARQGLAPDAVVTSQLVSHLALHLLVCKLSWLVIVTRIIMLWLVVGCCVCRHVVCTAGITAAPARLPPCSKTSGRTCSHIPLHSSPPTSS